jgi:hypothetical protein
VVLALQLRWWISARDLFLANVVPEVCWGHFCGSQSTLDGEKIERTFL